MWQEEHAEGDVALGDGADVAGEAVQQEWPRNIELDSGAMPGRATMIEASGEFERQLNQGSFGNSFTRGEKAYATGIGFQHGLTILKNFVHCQSSVHRQW